MPTQVYAICHSMQCPNKCCSAGACGLWYQCNVTLILALFTSLGTLLLLIVALSIRHCYIQRLLNKLLVFIVSPNIKEQSAHTKVNDLSSDSCSGAQDTVKTDSRFIKTYLKPSNKPAIKAFNQITSDMKIKPKFPDSTQNAVSSKAEIIAPKNNANLNLPAKQSIAPAIINNVIGKSNEIISIPKPGELSTLPIDPAINHLQVPPSISNVNISKTIYNEKLAVSHAPSEIKIDKIEEKEKMPYKIEVYNTDSIEEHKSASNESLFTRANNKFLKNNIEDNPRTISFPPTITGFEADEVREYQSEMVSSEANGIECIYDSNAGGTRKKCIASKSTLILDNIIDKHIMRSTITPNQVDNERDGFDFV